jgi:hypothetical protein
MLAAAVLSIMLAARVLQSCVVSRLQGGERLCPLLYDSLLYINHPMIRLPRQESYFMEYDRVISVPYVT